MILTIRRLAVLVAVVCAVIFLVSSRHWLLVGDASLMHYVVFLMGRGLAPYKDVVDVNLPGTYCVEWLAMHLFGDGSPAWRLFDVVLGLSAMAAMSAIAWPYDRLAGTFAGALFILVHGRDGMNELGQRDLVMTATLLWVVALVLYALRQNRISLIAFASAAAGIAITIKPTAALFWIAIFGYVIFWKTEKPWKLSSLLLAGLLPFFIAPAVFLSLMFRTHALRSFWFIATALIPFHNSLLRVSTVYFLLHPIPSSLIPLSAVLLVILALHYKEKLSVFNEAELLLALGVVCGLVSFFVQRKALPYHRYPADAFLIALASLSIFRALHSKEAQPILRAAGAVGLFAGAFVLAPQSLIRTVRLTSSRNDFSQLLQNDLTSLGGSSLDGRIQCIDFTAGCVTTLYRMKLTQSTGFLYDCYMFRPDQNAVVREYRDTFWRELSAHQPEVIVLSNQDCGQSNDFNKIYRWPELGTFIDSNYVFYKEVQPPDKIRWASQIEPPYSYRIYRHRSLDQPHPTAVLSLQPPQQVSAHLR